MKKFSINAKVIPNNNDKIDAIIIEILNETKKFLINNSK